VRFIETPVIFGGVSHLDAVWEAFAVHASSGFPPMRWWIQASRTSYFNYTSEGTAQRHKHDGN
jgi:hypothetical protein